MSRALAGPILGWIEVVSGMGASVDERGSARKRRSGDGGYTMPGSLVRDSHLIALEPHASGTFDRRKNGEVSKADQRASLSSRRSSSASREDAADQRLSLGRHSGSRRDI